MTNYWKLLWQRVSAEDSKIKAELAQIAVLQQTAADRRADYAAAKDQAALTRDSPTALLTSSRKRMEDAESAHTAALQIWENKQSRQKSR